MSDELIHDFLVESAEGLDRLDREFVELEKEPSNPELLASIFRVIHTIKGSCGFLGFSKLQDVAHAGESLLSLMRDGKLLLSPNIADALLATVDAIRGILSHIETSEAEGETDYSSLIKQLHDLQITTKTSEPSLPARDVSERPAETGGETTTQVRGEVSDNQTVSGGLEQSESSPSNPKNAVDAEAAGSNRAARGVDGGKIGGLLVRRGRIRPEDLVRALSLQDHGDRRRLGEILVEMGVVTEAQVRDALRDSKDAALTEGTIRVDVTLLDKLMNMVGELVLARNQVVQFTAAQADAAFLSASQRLNLITTELQEGVMKTRMLPIGQVWTKFPRVVRDLSVSCNRRVRLEMEGKDTELDKTLIEAIKDPLTHLVRNAVDHGIEPSEVRVQRGKPEEGRVLLRAYHEGGQVNIELSDDGAGVDPERIKRKALEKGLISPERAARMTEREAVNLIFLAGLSTAEAVTNVSGRGVGMDVVKTNIEKIGGTVDIQSNLGTGTTIKIKIPLTLAIISALVVSCCGDSYAIPQISVLELVRVESEKAASAIENIHGAPVYRLRGNLLPLVFLGRELGIEEPQSSLDSAAGSPQPNTKTLNIVVLQADDQQFGLVVDEINNTEEIVVKPIGQQLKGIAAYAGATIMGDGRVALILDVLGLAQHSRVVKEAHERARAATKVAPESQAAKTESLLLFHDVSGARMIIPLSQVERLEEFAASSLERVDAHQVVQYRSQIMPVVQVSDVVPERRRHARAAASADDAVVETKVQVVVFRREDRNLGLAVHRIIDVVEEAVNTLEPPARAGVLGSLVIQGKVTELLDVPLLTAKVLAEFRTDRAAVTVGRED